jgi:hypothetical protein
VSNTGGTYAEGKNIMRKDDIWADWCILKNEGRRRLAPDVAPLRLVALSERSPGLRMNTYGGR